MFMVFGAFLVLTFATMMFYSEIIMEKPIIPSLIMAIVGIVVFLASMIAYSIGKKKANGQVEKIQQIADKILKS